MPDWPRIRVGAAQINCMLAAVDVNLESHHRWVTRGREAGLDLLVFPELSLTGYALGAGVPEVAMARDDPRLLALASAAGPMQAVVGFVETVHPGEYANAAAVLQAGEVVAVHRKLNLPTYGALEEGKRFGRGRELTGVAVAPGWTASCLICADLWNPGLVHAAMLDRPSVLVAPANSAVGVVSEAFSNERNWSTNLAFHAMSWGTPVIYANRHGPEGEARFWGGSRVLGPRGEPLAEAGDGEEIVHATLDREDIARARFDLPTHRDADTPLLRRLLAERDQ